MPRWIVKHWIWCQPKLAFPVEYFVDKAVAQARMAELADLGFDSQMWLI